MQQPRKLQPFLWIAAGLILIAALAAALVLLNRPEIGAYQDAVWVFSEVGAP